MQLVALLLLLFMLLLMLLFRFLVKVGHFCGLLLLTLLGDTFGLTILLLLILVTDEVLLHWLTGSCGGPP